MNFIKHMFYKNKISKTWNTADDEVKTMSNKKRYCQRIR